MDSSYYSKKRVASGREKYELTMATETITGPPTPGNFNVSSKPFSLSGRKFGSIAILA
jgi:hypothetical protein